ncbi:type II toxin-antitoxin system BrnA family antitoxin [Nodosilinea sp. PGN35]|uniref:type II toxin-antitoxin system BrnA family antitoxin n=1 Tax=Nodosilinea sp. PGN35 TaxID=3020489 RepID=UPI0023B26205|nr:CopG family transcriptional regulator [Nodosilinea sp. TSF1-S3]MDF0369000.1 CopG family transcriptional regulator [Nodosilinea sp. TSF1-S3]
MKAEAFDQKFDEGQEDIIDDLDLSQIRRPGYEQRRIDVDFPVWMIEALDREALRLGVSRQSIIKVWIAERLEHAIGS